MTEEVTGEYLSQLAEKAETHKIEPDNPTLINILMFLTDAATRGLRKFTCVLEVDAFTLSMIVYLKQRGIKVNWEQTENNTIILKFEW